MKRNDGRAMWHFVALLLGLSVCTQQPTGAAAWPKPGEPLKELNETDASSSDFYHMPVSLDPDDYSLPGDNFEQMLSEHMPYDPLRVKLADELSKQSINTELTMEKRAERVARQWHPLVTASYEAYKAATTPEPPRRVAVLMVGAFRTLAEKVARDRWRNHLFAPLARAGYSVHLFALIKPVVAYSCNSSIAEKVFHQKNAQRCRLSPSRYWRSKHWRESNDILPVGAVRRILYEIMGGTEEFFTYQELERDCCGKYMRNPDPHGLGRCGYEEQFSMYYADAMAYKMMRVSEHERHATFDFIIKVRPDAPPVKDIVDTDPRQGANRLFVDNELANDVHRYCIFGDGQAMLPRYLGDVFFSAYRTQDDCPSHHVFHNHACTMGATELDGGRDHTCFYRLHLLRYGLVGADHHPLCTHSFKFWYLRPPVNDFPPAPPTPPSALVAGEAGALDRQATAVDLLREENGGGTDEEKRLVDVPIGGLVEMQKPLTAEQVQHLGVDASASVPGELWER